MAIAHAKNEITITHVVKTDVAKKAGKKLRSKRALRARKTKNPGKRKRKIKGIEKTTKIPINGKLNRNERDKKFIIVSFFTPSGQYFFPKNNKKTCGIKNPNNPTITSIELTIGCDSGVTIYYH